MRSLCLGLALLSLAATAAANAVKLDIKCSEHGKFACSDHDPTVFTRCLEGQLFQFYCPDGLHFNTQTQTCDWPEAADCTYIIKGGGAKGGHGHGKSSGGAGHHGSGAKGNFVAKAQEAVEEHHKGGSHGDGSQTNPWWRPKNVDPASWENVEHVWENPGKWMEGTEETDEDRARKSAAVSEEKAEEKSEHKSEHKSEPASKGHGHGHGDGHGHGISASADKTQPPAQITEGNGNMDGSCDRGSCQLPSCYCAGSEIPKGMSAKNTPQMVMITFDDEMSAEYYGYFQRLFRPGRYNPNGCPVRGALYVSGEGTEYDLVYPMYAMGMEIASHTVSHRFPHTWWSTASYDDFYSELEGMRKNLAEMSGIPYDSIKGFRVPFLQLGGDNMYKALHDAKFTYDTSMFTGPVWEEGDPVWPFTLDNVPAKQFCQHGPCPTKPYPGLWEIPVQRYYGLDGHSCAMADGCTATADAYEHVEFLRSNFKRYYNKNRAPFGIFVHARWFHTEHHIEALDMFVDELLSLPDVFIVTPQQVIEWMKNPTGLDGINHFGPWGCEGSVHRK